MDNVERTKENKLPDSKYFYSGFNKSVIKNEEYEHAEPILNKFNSQNL